MEFAVDVGGEVGHEHQELAQLVAAESPGAGVDYAVLGEQGGEALRVQGSALAQVIGVAHQGFSISRHCHLHFEGYKFVTRAI